MGESKNSGRNDGIVVSQRENHALQAGEDIMTCA